MATWVKFNEVLKFPHVIQKYQKQSAFTDAVKLEARTNKVWARVDPGLPSGGDSNLQVDVRAIPKVRPLTDNGKII